MMLAPQCVRIAALIAAVGAVSCGEDESSKSEAAANSRSSKVSGKTRSECNRECLLQMMQRYLDAVIAHDPSQLPISHDLKMTDNGVAAQPGDGIWNTATTLDARARLDFADPVTHNVATQCVINEGSSRAMYQVRLKVEEAEITEIESMTVRQDNAANGFFDPAALEPQPVFLKVPEESERMSRDELMALQEQYLDYLEGMVTGSQVPFDVNCARFENGFPTAFGLLSFQLQSWNFQVTRRVLIVDEELQITWGMFPLMQTDTALVVGEAFKLLDGRIMMIQAVMANVPAKAWD